MLHSGWLTALTRLPIAFVASIEHSAVASDTTLSARVLLEGFTQRRQSERRPVYMSNYSSNTPRHQSTYSPTASKHAAPQHVR